MNNNPLSAPIAKILRSHPGGLSEYELLKQLEFDCFTLDHDCAENSELLLFRKHFLVMNALYILQPIMWEEGDYLSISAINIELQPIAPESTNTLPCEEGEQALRDYYLDWSQFEQSSDESVEQLLAGFWQRYFAEDKKYQALTLLELEPDCSWSEIRIAYRRLAAANHPDRGGKAERFREIREAYELLACCQR
jgi:DNA-J related protein/DnaJ domain